MYTLQSYLFAIMILAISIRIYGTFTKNNAYRDILREFLGRDSTNAYPNIEEIDKRVRRLPFLIVRDTYNEIIKKIKN